MPTITFTFNMPEEQSEFDMAYHGANYHSCLWGLDATLRGWIKYGHEFKSADEVLEAARKALADIMNDHEVTFQP